MDGTGLADSATEFVNWRFDAYYQGFPWFALTYTAPAAGITTVPTLLLMGVGI